jgi:hypothetical protein
MNTNLIAEQLRQEAARLLRIAAELDSDTDGKKRDKAAVCPKTGKVLGRVRKCKN